jgi:hypothetical protein
MAMTARYHCIVHARNRHAGYGIPVVVYASTKYEAIDKAVEIGWAGRSEDARVQIDRVEEVVLRIACGTPDSGPS